MTDDRNPSEADTPGEPWAREQWTLGESAHIQELFRLLAIPPKPGYTPAAIAPAG